MDAPAPAPLALRYTGPTSTVEQAEAELTAVVPPDLLVRKLPGLFELKSSSDRAGSLLLPEGWELYEVTFADVNPPGVSLAGLRQRLAELKGDRA